MPPIEVWLRDGVLAMRPWVRCAVALLALTGSCGPAAAYTIFGTSLHDGHMTGGLVPAGANVQPTRGAGNLSTRSVGQSMNIAARRTQGYYPVRTTPAFVAAKPTTDSVPLDLTDGGKGWRALFKIASNTVGDMSLPTQRSRTTGIHDTPALELTMRAQPCGETGWADNSTASRPALAAIHATPAFNAAGRRIALTYGQLTGARPIALPAPMAAFAPPSLLKPPANHFQGRLRLAPAARPPMSACCATRFQGAQSPGAPHGALRFPPRPVRQRADPRPPRPDSRP